MKKQTISLIQPEYSYFIGFIQADGHLQKTGKNKGKLSIEISYKDLDILEKFQKIIPVNSTIYTRVRTTNFSSSHTGVTLNVFDKNFRDTINLYGVPYGKKSNIIKPPIQKYSEHDYWRGIIDADGSLGITGQGFPFISLVTASNDLYESYSNYLSKQFGIIVNLNKNKRDNVYNICLNKEKAQKVVEKLYYKNCLCLNRKKDLVNKITKWKRPKELKIKPKGLSWSNNEIEILKKNSVKQCLVLLPNRTETAIKLKKYRKIWKS